MRFVNRDGQEIRSLEEWRVLGKPAGSDHWRPGRSACELATDWIECDAASRVVELLAACDELSGATLVEGIAEKKTQFDDNPRGPRNHDLLVRGSCDRGVLVVGVEGKADEPFDDPLWRWRSKALARSIKSAAPQRLDALTKMFFGTTIDQDQGWPALGCIGYQLISALAGTLADAKREQAAIAVLLVQEFVTSQTHDSKHEVNSHVLDAFASRLGRTAANVRRTSDGWITSPVVVRGDGAWLPDSLPVVIAKMVTNTRASSPPCPARR